MKTVAHSFARFPDMTRFWQQPQAVPLSALRLLLKDSPCLAWVLQVETGTFAFLSRNVESILGYSHEQFREGGASFAWQLVHPQDVQPLLALKARIATVLGTVPSHQQAAYRFQYDYRLRKADGTYVRLLEQNSVLAINGDGNITHQLGVCTDITHWKPKKSLTATVRSHEHGCHKVFSAQDEMDALEKLSRREKEILTLIAEGYSSKQIADRLSISFHTVSKHRQHLFEKTQSRTMGELVRYAVAHEII
ncbi:PAS domain S-box-containing protein [Catalinimonas alkaloidigena]|uniref:PAS domain S-box-containing protein n=1 Tax=Catalinimonas alkaloidigena TaxID=1075417 RepID=A0A1G9GJE6_9BACT|nr:LuxR C-terminal-related transcriptional regulator [Catalinimonas alkaloidigena]SDL00413.1 PAS domain S-box-containing protein [Catalinimonas alkaloidigena]